MHTEDERKNTITVLRNQYQEIYDAGWKRERTLVLHQKMDAINVVIIFSV